ncbi:Eco57I restriction-modification methylase domain-containing protein [Microvirga tunisiensis]|uniref:site-specific DNA-methyltransferase (adenine-specific) n=1 Tax=Microvirga tunisiensis TaxID=2108360 RepID=A0A5N7MD90_9HYPH|nr:SAM-dependent methyltransferase [Microvirga tunisiensis]MPR06288.1 SAM-dependent methyltransferase [Microvirga tunisiensis]MPR24074.1 SAM-dependent methyltransferase [Microvirga tunisiensis]
MMDKETRNSLQNATQKARSILTSDFEEQLSATFDIMASGEIAPKGGAHLSKSQVAIRDRIVAAIEHKRAVGMKPSEAVQDYIRDAAFTTLNRFAALKMLEARELVRECITRGDQSNGYVEFIGAAPSLRLLADSEGYRLFFECIFDELSTEIKVLFDRRDPASLLWPRKLAFDTLLEVLNAADLNGVWGEDETIGWIYQYFNSREDVRRARYDEKGKPKPPQNSRELAVRNQFFTPNYVVRFLGDNTLGRIWYEMRQGNTRLKDVCEYMVRLPGETFAEMNEEVSFDVVPDGLSYEESWHRPVRVPFRPKKDPRSMRGLDPACGSGHFLLGLFDLFLIIYEEAWEDANSPAFDETGKTLREEYATLEELRRALPGLILKHNLHGVDIDPRCAQIAQLALWMRAQRAFKDFSVPRAERSKIRRSNIVIAEPMPGEKDLFAEFVRGLKEDRLEELLRKALAIPPEQTVRATKAMAETLAELIETVWEGMKLAGEMGTLLRIEQDLTRAIEKGRAEWDDRLPLFRVAEFGISDVKLGKLARVLPGGGDDFWTKAERLVFCALSDYASSATNGRAARRRLFVEDAAQGFALVDLVNKRFEVILMNPPFGAGSSVAKPVFERQYPRTKNDVYAAFIERGVSLLNSRARLGAITSRTGLFLSTFKKWREEILLKEARPVVVADLGMGVLDGAMVETAAYCLEVV